MTIAHYSRTRYAWDATTKRHMAIWWGEHDWAIESRPTPEPLLGDEVVENVAGLTHVSPIAPEFHDWSKIMQRFEVLLADNGTRGDEPTPTATAYIPALRMRFELWFCPEPRMFAVRRRSNTVNQFGDVSLETTLLDLADWYVSNGMQWEETHLGTVPRWQARAHTWFARTRLGRRLAQEVPYPEMLFWGGRF